MSDEQPKLMSTIEAMEIVHAMARCLYKRGVMAALAGNPSRTEEALNMVEDFIVNNAENLSDSRPEVRSENATVYVLMADGDGTMRSCDEPFGVAVTTKEEAERFVKEIRFACTQSYEELVVCDTVEEALDCWRANNGQ